MGVKWCSKVLKLSYSKKMRELLGDFHKEIPIFCINEKKENIIDKFNFFCYTNYTEV